MGTRSITIIMDDNQELARIYRQYDGYPEVHGIDLAKLCQDKLTNGLQGKGTVNGMGELAARVIMGLKKANCEGNVYLEAPCGEFSDWVEYVYIVRGMEGKKPTIECSTQTGPFPFNMRTKDAHVFTGSAAQWLKKFKSK